MGLSITITLAITKSRPLFESLEAVITTSLAILSASSEQAPGTFSANFTTASSSNSFMTWPSSALYF